MVLLAILIIGFFIVNTIIAYIELARIGIRLEQQHWRLMNTGILELKNCKSKH